MMTGRMTSDCVENFEIARGMPGPIESNHDIFNQVLALSSVDGSHRGENYLKNSVRHRAGLNNDIDGFLKENKIESKAYPRHHW